MAERCSPYTLMRTSIRPSDVHEAHYYMKERHVSYPERVVLAGSRVVLAGSRMQLRGLETRGRAVREHSLGAK